MRGLAKVSNGDQAVRPHVVEDGITTEGPARRGDPSHVGEFAQSIMLELRQMALGARCTYLAYLLELALIEASDLAAGRAPSSVAGGVSSNQNAEGGPDLDEIVQRILTAKA